MYAEIILKLKHVCRDPPVAPPPALYVAPYYDSRKATLPNQQRTGSAHDVRFFARAFWPTTTWPITCELDFLKTKSRPVGRLLILSWCRRRESNPRPFAYEATALPAELHRHERGRSIRKKTLQQQCTRPFKSRDGFAHATKRLR